LAMMVVGAGDVVFTFLGHPVPGALELAELLMVLVVFLALPEAEARGRHIMIDIVSSRLPKSLTRPLALLSTTLSLVFYGAMMWQAWRLFAGSWDIREHTSGLVHFPVYPAKALFALGLTAVTAVCTLNLMRTTFKRAGSALPGL
ncbi:MAG: TRAP transporter small permease, partial [Nitrospirota bacterium]